VGSALATAAGSGLLQTVATTGIEVVELIELEAWRVPDVWMEQLRHFLVPQWVMPVAGPTECLTEREREVLRLLPSRLTLREVASQLYVSQNTLKFHLRAIYRKLDVDSRTNAVEAARQRGMLPSN
jgi:LuxR family maltose regulon positive regulatory protein